MSAVVPTATVCSMHAFLTPDWIEAAEEIRSQYRDSTPEIPVAVTVNLKVHDAPDEVVSSEYHLDTSDGTLAFVDGNLDEADVTVSADYDLVRDLIINGDGEQFMRAFLGGQVQVQGDMARLMVLQAAMAQNAQSDAAQAVAEALRAVTA